MPVLKTISPKASPSAPKPVPRSVVPSSRTSRAFPPAMSGELSFEHGGSDAQEGGYHPAGQVYPGKRRVAALGRPGSGRLGGRRGVVQGEVGGTADGEQRAVPG